MKRDTAPTIGDDDALVPASANSSTPVDTGLAATAAEVSPSLLPALKALTSLRFFAAMHVIVYHLSAGHTDSLLPLPGRFVMSGYTGVSLFFVLSGFILAYNYREVRHRRQFWASRFARIYPVYLFALLLAFLYEFAPATPKPDHLWLRFALTATLLQSWYQPFAESFNGPGWTLSVEALFYAVFPFVVVRIGRMKRTVFAIFCGLYVTALGVPLGASSLSGRVDGPISVARYITWSRLPPMHLPMFLIGIYLGLSYLKATPAARERCGRWCLLGGGGASAALLCFAPSELQEPIRRGLLTLAYAALIYGLAPVRKGWLTSRWMVLAGEISFSIYILQMPVIRTVLGMTRRLGLGFYASGTVVVVVLIAVSFAAHRLIELPARVAIRGRLTHQ